MNEQLILKEDLIEWGEDNVGGLRNLSLYAREVCLINSKGHVVARRLAGQSNIFETYLRVRNDSCQGWKEVLDNVHTTELSSEVKDHLLNNGLLFYSQYDFPFISMKPYRWSLTNRSTFKKSECISKYQISSISEEIYKVEGGFRSNKIEWRVFFTYIPGFFLSIPAYSELWLDDKLFRRHLMLHRRWASPKDSEQFEPKKSQRIIPSSWDRTLRVTEYELPGIFKLVG